MKLVMMRRTTMAAPDNADALDTAWEEGKLGLDENSVRRSTAARELQIDEAAELQMISVRLQKELIEKLKFIADCRGIGYQPLMRDVLARFARSELLLIAKERIEKEQEEKMIAETMDRSRKRA